LVEEQVLWLEVPVHDALAMDVVNSLDKLLCVMVHNFRLHRSRLLDDVEEGAIRGQVSHQRANLGLKACGITPSCALNDLMKFDDVSVVELGLHLCFLEHARLLRTAVLEVEDLHCDQLTISLLASQLNRSACTGAKRLKDVVLTNS